MSEMMILHHYESSPYAEKIRLMFGFTGSSWHSLLSPVWPPRPNVDPLSGGYRRIPIAQTGADVFCDSALIAAEIAAATATPTLDPIVVEGDALRLMQLAEGDGFFAAIAAVPPLKLLGTMLGNFGPLGTWRFLKDRRQLMQGASSRPPAAPAAREVLVALFDALEARLGEAPWVGGDTPTVADFAVYHPIWLHLSCRGALPATAPNIVRWYREIGEFGHGDRREISREEAFAAARDADPRPLPASEAGAPLAPGVAVTVAPGDYGGVPVSGTLAAITPQRVIVARETPEFGALHVHFPREGYVLAPQRS